MRDRSPSVIPNTISNKQVSSCVTGLLLRFKEHWPLFCLAFISLILHLIIVGYSKIYIHDEGFYVPQALSIIHERGQQVLETNPTFLHHPSLAKLFITAGITIFGDNPWGWRIPSVIFGIVSIIIFYFICNKLAGKRTAFFGSFLLTFENFAFSWSGIATLDVFSVTFMLLSFLLFLHKKHVLSGTALALAGLCKLTGFFGVLVILGYWVLANKRTDVRKIGLLLLSSGVVFFLLMPVCDFIATSQWFNPIDRVYHMLIGAESMKWSTVSPDSPAAVGAAYPWQWITTFGYKWVGGSKTISFYFTPMLFIMIVPSMLYMTYELFKKTRKVAIFCLLWFGATYVIWIPIVLVTDRIMWQYYFFPTIGAVCLAIGFGLQKIWQMSNKTKRVDLKLLFKGLVVSYLVLYVLSFILVSTHFRAFIDMLS